MCDAPGLRYARKAMMGVYITFTLLSSKVNQNLVSENVIRVSKIIFRDIMFGGFWSCSRV